jgi:hypothetical protein
VRGKTIAAWILFIGVSALTYLVYATLWDARWYFLYLSIFGLLACALAFHLLRQTGLRFWPVVLPLFRVRPMNDLESNQFTEWGRRAANGAQNFTNKVNWSTEVLRRQRMLTRMRMSVTLLLWIATVNWRAVSIFEALR